MSHRNCECCGKVVPAREAHKFLDKDWFERYFCSKACLLKGMLAYSEMVMVQKEFIAAMES